VLSFQNITSASILLFVEFSNVGPKFSTHKNVNSHRLLTLMSFRTCMTLFLSFWNIKENIFKNVGNKTLLVNVDFHCIEKHFTKIICFLTKITFGPGVIWTTSVMFLTFLGLESGSRIGWQWRDRNHSGFITNIFIYVPKMNRNLRSLDQYESRVSN